MYRMGKGMCEIPWGHREIVFGENWGKNEGRGWRWLWDEYGWTGLGVVSGWDWVGV